MHKVTIGLIASFLLCSSTYPQDKAGEKPAPVSKQFAKLPKLPPVSKSNAGQPAPPPPPPTAGQPAPPAPPPSPPRYFDVLLPAAAATAPWAASDFQLPPGEVSVNWVALGPGNTDVSSGIDLTVLSPQIFYKPATNGAARLVILPPGANVRVLAQRKGFAGPFQVRASIELRAVGCFGARRECLKRAECGPQSLRSVFLAWLTKNSLETETVCLRDSDIRVTVRPASKNPCGWI
jgi:hypothetical protein